ncbi:uncharacterized protein EHS24_000214 [Apiotrichum porosum]|uniref:Uncharacterized protein n=1 Tax=Apiotrichum porosum TaxID=105984 RepID=A0A427Y9B9_9TREE|nr:uncharacterized protein EHS24_000214 [Apiotrichum porosum]RSH87698.1 hypothetical protein EHS24_000214 [Apiotrichum porosum]
MGWHDVLTGGSMFNGEAHSRRLLFSAFAEHINPALLALLVRSLDGSMPTAPELAATGGYDESAFLAYLKIALREDREDTTPADLVYSGHTRQPRSRRTQHESDSRNGVAGMGIWQSYAKAADEFTDLQFTGTVIVPEPSTPAENVLDGLLVHFAEASSHIGSAHVSANILDNRAANPDFQAVHGDTIPGRTNPGDGLSCRSTQYPQLVVANDKNKTVLDSKLKLTDKPEETEPLKISGKDASKKEIKHSADKKDMVQSTSKGDKVVQ